MKTSQFPLVTARQLLFTALWAVPVWDKVFSLTNTRIIVHISRNKLIFSSRIKCVSLLTLDCCCLSLACAYSALGNLSALWAEVATVSGLKSFGEMQVNGESYDSPCHYFKWAEARGISVCAAWCVSRTFGECNTKMFFHDLFCEMSHDPIHFESIPHVLEQFV